MGTHYANFRAIVEDLMSHDAMRIASSGELSQTLLGLLAGPEEARATGARARQVFEQQAGATERSVQAVRELLPRAIGTEADSHSLEVGR
jgi:3-deoxy-D-manno-octulosonic-acid transferase